MAILPPVRTEEHDAVSDAPIVLGALPCAVLIEPHNGCQPGLAIQIRPLIRESKMNFDQAITDRFNIEHARVAAEIWPYPLTAIRLQQRSGSKIDGPMIKCPAGN